MTNVNTSSTNTCYNITWWSRSCNLFIKSCSSIRRIIWWTISTISNCKSINCNCSSITRSWNINWNWKLCGTNIFSWLITINNWSRIRTWNSYWNCLTNWNSMRSWSCNYCWICCCNICNCIIWFSSRRCKIWCKIS